MERTGVGRAEPARPHTEPLDIAHSQSAREQARLKGRRWAAELAGAMEGLLESIEEYHLEENVEDATREARRVTTATMDETRHQMQTPEGQRLRRDVRHGADVVAERSGSAMETAEHAVEGVVDDTRHAMESGWQATSDAVEETWDRVKHGVDEATDRIQHAGEAVVDETKARSMNLARAGRRSRRAPGAILQDVRQAAGARAKGMAAGVGLFALAGAVALTGFIVLTIAIVNGLNAVAGAPEGAFIAAFLYLLAGVGIAYGAMAARRKAQEEADQHMRDARYEVQNVTRPLKRVFASYRITPPREDIEPQAPELEYNDWKRR